MARLDSRSACSPVANRLKCGRDRPAVELQGVCKVDDNPALEVQPRRWTSIVRGIHSGGIVNTHPLVLVADDEPRITKLVALTLHDEGFRVVTASGGEEALKKAEEVRPDIVLLDIVMPDLDGIEVMRQLREWRPVPVILLTAKGSTADKAKGLDLGADDYIAKPFHPDELAARVRAVLRRAAGITAGAGVVAFGDIEIDLERRMVTKAGELV
jgi:DNA-binding response OmpR family regulator